MAFIRNYSVDRQALRKVLKEEILPKIKFIDEHMAGSRTNSYQTLPLMSKRFKQTYPE